jgi:hypothetical protein
MLDRQMACFMEAIAYLIRGEAVLMMGWRSEGQVYSAA